MMLITSTRRTAGPTTKNTRAPQPSDAHGLRPTFCCTVRSCLGISAVMTSASTRQNAVCSSQPMKLKPPGFSRKPLAAQPKAPPRSTPSKVSVCPTISAPGACVSLPPKSTRDASLVLRSLPSTASGPTVTSPPNATVDVPTVPRIVTSPPNATTASVTVPSTVMSPPKTTTDGVVVPAGTYTSSPNWTSAPRWSTMAGSPDGEALAFAAGDARRRRRRLGLRRRRRLGPGVRGPGDRQPQQHQQGGQRRQRQGWREDPRHAVRSHGVTSESLHGRLVSSSEGVSPG